jgi:hypothetical protein
VDNLNHLEKFFTQEYSSGELLWHSLIEDPSLLNEPCNIILTIQQIIKRDCLSVLSRLEKVMWDIQDHATSEDMQGYLYFRPWILAQAQDQLRLIARCLVKLQDATTPKQTQGLNLFPRVYKEITEGDDLLMSKWLNLQSLVNNTRSVLSSQVSMLVGEQQLEEASAVTWLTELAFVFVPLGFATSFFGMQIKVSDFRTFEERHAEGLQGTTESNYSYRLAVDGNSSHGGRLFWTNPGEIKSGTSYQKDVREMDKKEEPSAIWISYTGFELFELDLGKPLSPIQLVLSDVT